MIIIIKYYKEFFFNRPHTQGILWSICIIFKIASGDFVYVVYEKLCIECLGSKTIFEILLFVHEKILKLIESEQVISLFLFWTLKSLWFINSLWKKRKENRSVLLLALRKKSCLNNK